MAIEEITDHRIVLLSLHHEPYFDEMYQALLGALQTNARVQRVKQAAPAMRLLSEQPRPTAVIITDEALAETQNANVWEATLRYVRQGGTAVVMGSFASFVQPLDMKPFFSKAGLPWEAGGYSRTTIVLNRDAVGRNLATQLPREFSQKGLGVKNVASSDIWYRSDDDVAMWANAPGETTVAFANVGQGHLGYVGDVNNEKGSDAAILAMCGLPPR